MFEAKTDAQAVLTLPGYENQWFIVEHQGDGTILLTPFQIDADLQAVYDNDPELQERLAAAATSPTVRRTRGRRI